MEPNYHIGIDLGGTHIRGGLVAGQELAQIVSQRIQSQGSVEAVLQGVFQVTDQLMQPAVASIGIGVPGLVDEERGVVYDVVNIPSWKEVPLQQWMQDRYGVPVYMNNDANCFALGEFYFGKGKGRSSLIGLTIGTGLGTGIIIQNKLYAGANGGAGEFGMVDYRDRYYEYYASGQFFKNIYGIDGETVFQQAQAGDGRAIGMYEEMGRHLGNAIKMIQYALDMDFIVLGGSVRQAWPWFQKSMWESIHNTAFQRSARRLQIEISELPNSGLLGAAALYYDAQQKGKAL